MLHVICKSRQPGSVLRIGGGAPARRPTAILRVHVALALGERDFRSHLVPRVRGFCVDHEGATTLRQLPLRPRLRCHVPHYLLLRSRAHLCSWRHSCKSCYDGLVARTVRVMNFSPVGSLTYLSARISRSQDTIHVKIIYLIRSRTLNRPQQSYASYTKLLLYRNFTEEPIFMCYLSGTSL